MITPVLPPPPSADEIGLAWFAANKETLAAYMQAVYAGHNLKVVVVVDGVRLPPVSVKYAGDTAQLEITV